ncbi:hypothetical protein OIV83_003087 [Microbotryomycetes sp. JL201]|nr:hypothetical protein OIV83_003087 [Microbotryomycetes sp. JL201]
MVHPLGIVPGDSLGDFKTGSDLFHVINVLRTAPREYPQVNVAWNDETPTTSDMHLYVSRPPLVLTFEPAFQRLLRIELSNPEPAEATVALTHWIQYKGKRFTDAGESNMDVDEEDVVKSIRRVMGPTYGSSQASTSGGSRELLAYPGVAFEVERQSKSRSQLRRVVLTPLPPPAGIPIDQAWLHPQLFEHSDFMSLSVEMVVIQLDAAGKPASIDIKIRPRSAQAEPPAAVRITLGHTSTEDLLCDLGSPNRSFWKEDRMPTSGHTLNMA